MQNILTDTNIRKEGQYVPCYILTAAGREWKDVTRYSQGDKDRVPNKFEYSSEGIRIGIYLTNFGYKMYCYSVMIDLTDTLYNCQTPTEAANKAVKILKDKIAELQAFANNFTNDK